MKLPQFLKELESFKAGNYEQALKDAFIHFDATLLEDKVIEELRQLARKNPDYEDSDMDEDDETAEEIVNLHQEATMPLNEVLEKYKGNKEQLAKITTVQQLTAAANKWKKEAEGSGGPSSSSAGGSGSSSSSPSGSGSSRAKKSASDNEVSSSSSKPASGEADTGSEPSSSSAAIPEQAPDSTHIIPKSSSDNTPEQSTTESTTQAAENGISASDYKVQPKSSDDEAISSSSAQENGESASSCPSSSSSQAKPVSAGGSASGASASKSPKVPNQISSSSLAETDSDESSDDENDETYKESPGKLKPLNSDDDTTEEEMDPDMGDSEELDEEESEEELSGDEDGYDDEFMNNMETGPGKASGCTAVVALVSGRELYVANAGDSRCVLCRAGKVVEMSFDHKPEDEIELNRIKKAGGRVTLDGRVNGGLNLSRAIGDHGYKTNKELSPEEQMISALPDIKRVTLQPDDEVRTGGC